MAKGGGKARGCARELCALRAVGLFCAVFSFLYGCVVSAASVPELKYNEVFAGANIGAGALLLLCSFIGMVGWIGMKKNAIVFFLISELVLGCGMIALSYAAASQQLAFCRGIHIWQHNALILDPTKPEEKLYFANSTVTVELPTEYQDFTDKMFHKRMEEVTGQPGTQRFVEECDGFFFGNGSTAVEAVIIIVFLKTMLSCFVSMSFIINLIKKEVAGAVELKEATREISMV